MKIAFRLFLLLIVFLATYLFIFWLPFSLIPFGEKIWIPNIVSLFVACGMGWYIWNKSASTPDKLITYIFSGAAMIGAIGFVLGFFGPIVFTPGANQGPLLGIFITGPLGFLLGGIGGGVYWLIHKQTSSVFKFVANIFIWLLWAGVAAAVVFVIATFTYVPWRASKFSSDVNNIADLEKRDNSLTSLSVRFLSDSAFNQIVKFKKLNYLDFTRGWGIEEAKITDAGLENISQLDLPDLEWLMLGYCTKITDAGMRYVADIKGLKHLSLMGCQQITDAGLENIKSLITLEYLDLRGCNKITNHGLLYLTAMKGLKEILLGGCNNITPEGIEKAHLNLPNCKIEKNDAEWTTHLK